MNALVELIEEAIQREEAMAAGPEWRRGHPDACNWPGDIPGYCDCGSAERVQRRCEADRVVLQQHRPTDSAGLVCGVCIEPGYIGLEHSNDWPTVPWPCPTLAALATAHGVVIP